MKFLHLADVHLDTAFDGRSADLRKQLREALREAFRRAVDAAMDEAVDAVLIAGDLFDDERLSFVTEAFLVDQLQRLSGAGIDVIGVTGNHDPGGTGHRAAEIDWPDGTRVVRTREPRWLDVRRQDGTLAGRVAAAGHVSARESENLAAAFPPAKDDGVPHVGLLHAHVTSAAGVEAHDRYAPCTVQDLQRTSYDYWALGHVHTRQRVDDAAQAWYPGNLQGRTPRETGAKGGLLVEVEAGQVASVTFCPFAPVRWQHLRLDDLSDAASVQALTGRVRSALRETVSGTGDDAERAGAPAADNWLLRVTLSGPSPLAETLREDDAVADLERVLADRLQPFDVLDVDVRTSHLTPPVDVDAYRGETHLAGEVLSVLDRLDEDDDLLDAVAPDVLAGCDADDPDARRAYLRSLLNGLDREAVDRLVK